jgi:hypothetical protein
MTELHKLDPGLAKVLDEARARIGYTPSKVVSQRMGVVPKQLQPTFVRSYDTPVNRTNYGGSMFGVFHGMRLWMVICSALVAWAVYFGFGMLNLYQREWRIPVEQREIAIDRERSAADTEIAMNALKVEQAKRGLSLGVGLSQATLPVEVFSCYDRASQERGFANSQPQVFAPGKTYRIPQGCAMVRTGVVTSISGSGYFIQQGVNPEMDGCSAFGMNDGRPRSHAECASWLARHAGENVRITIKSGGYLIINQ